MAGLVLFQSSGLLLRLGFEVAGRHAEGVTGCDYWLMLRPAAGITNKA
ncbi:hypothetical protein [Janthinobacterium sp. HLX7-2]